MKEHLKKEGASRLLTNCQQAKLKANEYTILTDEITKSWSGMNTRQYKNYKGLKKESLRDNMSTTELILNMLAETSAKDISKKEKPGVG